MNILQVIPELNVGGVETGTLDLAKYLVRQKHKAIVVSAGGQLVQELQSCGAIHYQLPVHKKSLVSIIKTIPHLVRIIKKEEIDIVHARSRVPAWIAYFACLRTNAVFITTCHGFYKKHAFSHVMGWAKRVIVISNVIARHMVDDFKVPCERIRLVPRSVDLEKFKFISPEKKRKKVFNVGIIARITPIKGHLHFIKAMARVSRRVAHLKIWIIGDAPASRLGYKEELQVLIRRLGLSHCTEFLGTQRDISGVLSNLDLLVLATTSHEAFGRVIIEAQASGVPVVATRVGGVVDIIDDEKTGLFVSPADPASMAEGIMKIHNDLQLAKRLAEEAYKKVQEKYRVELMVKNTLDIYHEALANFKILIIKFSSLGDVVLSTAAIREMRKKFSDNYNITFLTGEEAKEVLLTCPYIDELMVGDFKNKDKGLRGILNLANILRKKNFDIVIDLQNNRRSHILSFLTFCKDRYGYDNAKFGFLLNHRIKDEKPPINPIEHQFRILHMLGIELTDPTLELWPRQIDFRYIDEFLSSHWLSANQKIVGINISASQRWLSKNWPLEHLVKLCQDLSLRDMRVVITGTLKDLAESNILMEKLKDKKVINACGKTTVNQLACLIKRCSVFISADSSPLHIAASVGTPFIALFGPTDPRRHLLPGRDYAVIKKELPCSPCYKPRCKDKKCMELITPKEVLEAVDKLLNSNDKAQNPK
jgi:lipopolysaccharide heptosyltransferase II